MSLHLFKHLNGKFKKKNKKMAGDWTVCFTFRNKFFFFFKFPSSKWQPMQIAAKENERGGWERTPPVTWSFDIFVARRPSTFFFFFFKSDDMTDDQICTVSSSRGNLFWWARDGSDSASFHSLQFRSNWSNHSDDVGICRFILFLSIYNQIEMASNTRQCSPPVVLMRLLRRGTFIRPPDGQHHNAR